ncbi:MAG: rhodanese-like domain-containing protein [Halolamina sp.]|uniref:rhodanese-like domain-containing protein n=1 Tax=Halolamina sp. TaxID=1940283 RepID=UPI002FC3D662
MDGEISTAELRERLDGASEPTVVDIRQPPAFRRGHIPGSVNIPFRQLPDRVAEVADADHIVTVCPHGKSSVQAAKLVASNEGAGDATVQSMAGGLREWDGEIDRAFEDAEADEGPEAPF